MANTKILSEQIADDAVTGAKIENTVTIATSITSPLVDGQNFKVNGAQGSNGQVLTSTGSGVQWASAAGGGDVVDDTSPQLGGQLDTRTFGINGDIADLQLKRAGNTKLKITSDGTELNKKLIFNLGPASGSGSADSNSIHIGNNFTARGGTENSDGLDHDQINNTIIGMNSLLYVAGADYNVAIGNNTGKGDSSAPNGSLNETVVIGYGAMAGYQGQNSIGNVAIGYQAAAKCKGNYNVNIGHQAGEGITSGYFNICIGGRTAGDTITTGYQNIIMGTYADAAAGSANAIVMGHSVQSAGDSSFTFGTSGNDSNIANGATTITAPSDERYKEDITDATAGLSFIKDLRPVTFKWKKEKDIPDTQKAYVADSETRVMNDKTNHGFVAQEVKAVIDNHPEIKDGFDMWMQDEADGRQRLGPSALIPILVKAIQELEARVVELEA